MSVPGPWDELKAEGRIASPRLGWTLVILFSAAVGALVATLLSRILR